MKTIIEAIGAHLPKQRLSNSELHEDYPEWDMAQAESRTGITSRHVAAEGETAVDLAERACEKLFHKIGKDPAALDAVIFCTQTPDHFLPPNACILHKRLNLKETTFAFDLNMGCSGFVNGLALADGLIRSGQARDLILLTADTITKRIHPKDRSTRVVFGDGAAATWISAGEEDRGLIDIENSTCGAYYDRIIIPAGGCRLPSSEATSQPETDSSGNVRTPENFYMDGLAVLAMVNSRVPDQIRRLLERNQLQPADIDLFLFHQASKPVLDSLTSILGLEPRQVYRNLKNIGNTFSASIPLALEDAFNDGTARRGDLVLMSGFGIGLAWASAIIRL